MDLLRIAAGVTNLGLIGIISVLVIREPPHQDDAWWIVVFFVAPLLTLALLWRDRDAEERVLRSKLRRAELRKRLTDVEAGEK